MDLDTRSLLLYGVPGAMLLMSWYRSYRQNSKTTIPALVGTKGPISSYLAAVHLLGHGMDVIQQGYDQYRDGVFRIPTLFRWDYVANGSQRLGEIASAPDHILSFTDAAQDTLQSDYTLGPELAADPYHILAIRGNLTRNLGRCFPELRDEIVHAFNDVLALEGKEWKLVPVVPSIMQVVARTSNRMFVGVPLCREQEYIDLQINYTVEVFLRAQVIGLIPGLLKPFLAPLISTRKSALRRALKFLGPTLNDRVEKDQKYGRNWPERPNDLISWLLDIARDEQRTTSDLATRILSVNVGAIHTSTMGLASVLYDLTTYPDYILPMREEVERVIAEEGWTKASLARMHKIDSFIRESQRMAAIGAIILQRKVVAKDGFTFSDGTNVPCGAFLSVPGNSVHYDQDIHDNADVFDGFRFSRLRDEIADQNKTTDGSPGKFFNQQMVATSKDHLVFGHGRHACPGRFLAATELKAMLAHILINYDVKAETEGGVRPQDQWFGMGRFPSRRGRIFIRKRDCDDSPN